jgi:hypothetical protein
MVVLPRVAVTLPRIYQHFVDIASRPTCLAYFTPDRRGLNPFIITAAGSTSSLVVMAWGLTRGGAIPDEISRLRALRTSATDGTAIIPGWENGYQGGHQSLPGVKMDRCSRPNTLYGRLL